MEELILGWPKELLGHCRPLMGKTNLGDASVKGSVILGMAQDPQRRNAMLPPPWGKGLPLPGWGCQAAPKEERKKEENASLIIRLNKFPLNFTPLTLFWFYLGVYTPRGSKWPSLVSWLRRKWRSPTTPQM